MKYTNESWIWRFSKGFWQNLGFGGAMLFNRNNLDSYVDEYARANGYVADNSGRGMGMFEAFLKGGTPALGGRRKGTTKDIGRMATRETLRPQEVRDFQAGGINFDDFTTAKGYVNRYMREQLNNEPPDNWDAWIANTKDGLNKFLEHYTSALRFYAKEIAGVAEDLARRRAGLWRATFESDVKRDRLLQASVLGPKQWEIYNKSYYGPGNAVDWNAGGVDWRAKWSAQMGHLGQKYGLWAESHPAHGIQAEFDEREAMWQDRVRLMNIRRRSPGATSMFGQPPLRRGPGDGALSRDAFQWGGLEFEKDLGMLVQRGKADDAKTQKVRRFLEMLPSLRGMATEEAMSLFKELTGRDPMTDIYARTNFDNFVNADPRNFGDIVETRRGTQYEQATEFGSAQAYNELLQRDQPLFDIRVAVDRAAEYLETLTVEQREMDDAMKRVTESASNFFERAESSRFFDNIEEIAENYREDGAP